MDKMKHYNVSIIIPVYNVESYVRESLLSALNQTFESIEYIIVDDCCTDCSMDVIQKVLQTHPRGSDVYIYRHEKNGGLSAARNTGMEKATGEYVFFMDSDDEIISDCIEKHYNAIKKNDACFSIANIKLQGSKSVHIKDFTEDCTKKDLLSSFFLREWNVSACNKLYNRKFLLENDLIFQKGLLQEDILWSYHLCLHADKAAWIKDRTYIYKVRENSITKSKVSARKIESMLFILHSMVDDWEKGVINRKYEKEFTFMINFYRLNASLLLLNYAGSRKDAVSYYRKLNLGRLKSVNTSRSLQSIVLEMPFSLFCMIMSPVYSLYKTIK